MLGWVLPYLEVTFACPWHFPGNLSIKTQRNMIFCSRFTKNCTFKGEMLVAILSSVGSPQQHRSLTHGIMTTAKAHFNLRFQVAVTFIDRFVRWDRNFQKLGNEKLKLWKPLARVWSYAVHALWIISNSSRFGLSSHVHVFAPWDIYDFHFWREGGSIP